MGSYCLMNTEFLLKVMTMFWKLIVPMVDNIVAIINISELYP